MMRSPGLINIDVTGLCNKTCNYCPRSSGYPNENKHMSMHLFAKFVMDAIKENYRGVIDFTGRGENSLHPDFSVLVRMLHHENRKYKTRIITNGYRLKERLQYFDEFDIVIINSYDSIENMKERIRIMPRAIHRFWDQDMKPEEWGETPIKVSNRSDIYNLIATDKSEINTPCTFPSIKMWVHWDGTIQKCCNDWTNTEIYGDISKDNIFRVWESAEWKELQEQLIDGNRQYSKTCSMCNRGIDARDRDRIQWLYRKRRIAS